MAATKREPQEHVRRAMATASHEELLRRAAQGFAATRNIARLASRCVVDAEGAAPDVARMGAGQFHALSALYEQGPLMAGELAERCHVAEPTVSKMLKSLEAGGLIERRTDPTNRRVVWVSLTPAGRATRDRMMAHFVSRLTQVLDPLDDAQLADLIVAFGHLEHLLAAAEHER